MQFRIFILKDPHAAARGFSLKGIKVPLRDWCPRNWSDDVAMFNGKRLPNGRYQEFWQIPCEDLIKARPMLFKHIRHVDHILVPTEYCDISPVDHEEQAWGNHLTI